MRSEDKTADKMLFIFSLVESLLWMLCTVVTLVFGVMYMMRIGTSTPIEYQPFVYAPVVFCIFILARSVQGVFSSVERATKLHHVD